MQNVFSKILELSLIGSYCILLMLPVRLFLLRCKRKYVYYLWLAVFLNFLSPFTVQGNFSLIPRQVVKLSVMPQEEFKAQSAKENINDTKANSEKNKNSEQMETASVNWWQESGNISIIRDSPDITDTMKNTRYYLNSGFCFIWMLGMVILVLINLFHCFMVKQQITSDKWVYRDIRNRIIEIDGLASPFLWGFIRPVIYLPSGLLEEEKKYIIAHESCHRRRGDSVVKLFIFVVMTVHWFNPLIWLAWALFCRDMEVSCDEAVLAGSQRDIKKQYAQTLLKYAASQNGYMMTPLTFGEPSVKSRIKNVLYFRKKNMILTGFGGCVAIVVACGMAVRPKGMEELSQISYQNIEENDTKDYWQDIWSYFAELPINQEKQREEMIEPEEILPINDEQSQNTYKRPHREGYVEAKITNCTKENIYFTPGLRTEEELDALAQRALRELYDLTGVQIEECVYQCTDLGSFYFGKTKEALDMSCDFYSRNYGTKEGYGENTIGSIYIANARRVWYSDIQQLDVPYNIEQMSEGEMAVWFLERSPVYEGEEVLKTERYGDDIRVIMIDGSFYEVRLDKKIWAVSSIYGPYPEDFSH